MGLRFRDRVQGLGFRLRFLFPPRGPWCLRVNRQGLRGIAWGRGDTMGWGGGGSITRNAGAYGPACKFRAHTSEPFKGGKGPH